MLVEVDFSQYSEIRNFNYYKYPQRVLYEFTCALIYVPFRLDCDSDYCHFYSQ